MRRTSLFILSAAVTAGAVLLSLLAGAQSNNTTQTVTASAQLFDPVASVLMGPRCSNCHQVNFPRQKDTAIRHIQHVLRGPDGHGVPSLQCSACHQAANSIDGKVPGAPNWHLAPVSMSWEGLTKAQICAAIKDPARNGGRDTLEKVIEHMSTDPLVLWAWKPGAERTTPVASHAQFVGDLERWVAAGGPCLKE